MKETKHKILIVDDITENINFICRILRNSGYQISYATSGIKALDITNEVLPDVILLDIMMPGMSGFEVCETIKNNDKTKHIPIIFITANNEIDSIVKGFEIGGSDYILKPFNPTELTSRVKNHLNLKLFGDRLIETNSKLEKSLSQKNRLISILSHDLRSPLGGLISLNNVMIDYFDRLSDEEFKSYLNSFRTSLDKQLELLDELLEWVRLDSDVVKLENRSIRDDIESVISYQMRNAIAKNIVIENTISQDLVAIYEVTSINAVMRNLISNAIKFTPENGKIKIYSKEDDSSITLFVEDNGIGMSELAVSRLFILGKQFTTDGTNKEKGTGFGLLISHDLVKKNGGVLKVKSKLDEGTTFSFNLNKSTTEELDS